MAADRKAQGVSAARGRIAANLHLLAQEQLAGSVASLRGPYRLPRKPPRKKLARRIEEAWGIEPFDAYAATETRSSRI